MIHHLPRIGPGSAPETSFHWGSEFTVGVEDELMLVDSRGELVGSQAAVLHATLQRVLPVPDAATGEIFAEQLELRTPVCADGDEIARSMAALRRAVAAAGVGTMAVGVHPTALLGTAATATSARYDRIVDELAGLLRTPTAATQVHVGLPDPEAAIRAYRGLRNRLFLLRALAAGSPYWHGRDSGLASARSAITRSYPRVTQPPPLRDWDEYRDVTARLLAASDMPDYTYVWWELRPQPRLGTLEVRTMDAQHSVARVAGLTALVQGLARHAVEVPDLDDLPDDVLTANDHRACRYGLETTVMDLDGRVRPLRGLAVAALDDARRMLASDGLDRPLEVVESMLSEPSEPARQRQLCEEQGMQALLDDLLRRTAQQDM